MIYFYSIRYVVWMRTRVYILCLDSIFVQGLSYVISAMAPAQAAADALKRLVEPISATLERDGAVAGDAKLAQQDLDRLTVIVSHADLTVEVRRGRLFLPRTVLGSFLWTVLGSFLCAVLGFYKLLSGSFASAAFVFFWFFF